MLKFKFVNAVFVLVFALDLVLIWNGKLPIYSILLVLAGWLVITFLGATNVRWDYFFPMFHKNPDVKGKKIALTFDDGPSELTLEILKILKKHRVKATFFCIGHAIDEYPEIVKQIIADGHIIGNHTYSHTDNWGFMKAKRAERELHNCNKAAKSHTGLEMNLFRTPFGVTNPNIKKALKQTGHQCVGWSVRSFDAMISSEDLIFRASTRNLKKGDVILFHDTKAHTVALLERLLLFLRKKQFETITVDKLFKIDAYRATN